MDLSLHLEVRKAPEEVVLGVLVLGVLLELRLGHRAHEGGHAHLALDVHRCGVGRVLAPCVRCRSQEKSSKGSQGGRDVKWGTKRVFMAFSWREPL